MNRWYATFGHGQTHPLTGEELVYCYTLVPAVSREHAHTLMMRTVFGQEWAFLYDQADGKGGAGVDQFKLREVPFIAPSPMSEVVWAAYSKLEQFVSVDRWIEEVSQPIELAWYRWHAAQQDEHIRRARIRAMAAAMLTPDANDLPRSAEEEQAEAASGVNDRSHDEPTPDTTNDHLVGIQGDRVIMVLPPTGPIVKSEALRMAAWLVAVADPGGEQFERTLRAVRST